MATLGFNNSVKNQNKIFVLGFKNYIVYFHINSFKKYAFRTYEAHTHASFSHYTDSVHCENVAKKARPAMRGIERAFM